MKKADHIKQNLSLDMTLKKYIHILLISLLIPYCVYSQSKKTYVTSGAELIFSFANINYSPGGANSILRFAPIVNLQSMLNKDVNDRFGFFTGLAVRNVGYRMDGYKDPADGIIYRKAFRSYNLGVPLGIKVGHLNGLFFYGGYEFEMCMLYKEKTYEDGDKIDKITGWFSDRQNKWQSSVMIGIQFPYALNLKFKYYLTEFHNQNYTNSVGLKPYAGLESHVFYFSLSCFLFRDVKIYYVEKE